MSAPWSRAASAAQRGASLVGLLIASAVGALVMAGGLTGLARAQSAWQAAGIESRLHERAQYALATLEPELQMAGFFAGAPPQPLPPGAVPPSATRCGEPVVARLDVPIEVTDARYPLTCAAGGSGHRDGTDVFIVRRLSTDTDLSPGRMQWPLCPVEPCTTAPDLPRELVIKVFYVAQAADGDPHTPALRMRSLSAIAGVPAFIDTEVMPGVDDLQITLEPAAAPRSVRITVGVRPDAADQSPRQASRRLAVTRTFALRNAAAAS